MKLMNSHLIMSYLKDLAERILQAISYPPVERATRAKVAVIGKDGCVRHLDISLTENN
jgi:hypothetical protein